MSKIVADEIVVEPNDVRMCVVAVERYCIVRLTYMQSFGREFVFKNLHALDDGTRQVLAKDIRDEAESLDRTLEAAVSEGNGAFWRSLRDEVRLWEQLLPKLEVEIDE